MTHYQNIAGMTTLRAQATPVRLSHSANRIPER